MTPFAVAAATFFLISALAAPFVMRERGASPSPGILVGGALLLAAFAVVAFAITGEQP